MAVTAGEHWKVGELARATGLTVRTLHHYDEIGLLVPSLRTPAGHRLYTGEDVRLLYRLIALRRLGFGLERIAECLHDRVDPRALVADQLRAVDRRIAAEQQLRTRLAVVLNVLDRNGEVFTADFLKLIEETQMTEETIRSYYTPAQLDWLAQRAEEVGTDTIRSAEAEWPRLYERAQAEFDAGTDPADPKVQGILARMDELLAGFHGGRDDIKASLGQLWSEQGDQLRATYGGPSPELTAYLDRARETR